jgi:putative flippase GtrA
MKQQLIRFGAVGIIALIIHFIVVLIISTLGINPLIANIIAFSIAFHFSYWGHSQWTFETNRSHKSLVKFIIVSVTSFCFNEILFWLLLKYTEIPYQIALLMVLGFVAGLTFILGRYWAFKPLLKSDEG